MGEKRRQHRLGESGAVKSRHDIEVVDTPRGCGRSPGFADDLGLPVIDTLPGRCDRHERALSAFRDPVLTERITSGRLSGTRIFDLVYE